MFAVGVSYTRAEIQAHLGGSRQGFLPHVNGRVVAACLRVDANPDAPSMILVGRGTGIEHAAKLLVAQGGEIPMFLKRRTGEWEYAGDFAVERSSRDAAELAEHSQRSQREDITLVVHMAPVEPRAPSFVTYENYRNPHVTIHSADCGQIRKRGGRHTYGQGGYRDHETFDLADAYARSKGLQIVVCSFCRPAPFTGMAAAVSGVLPEEVDDAALFEGAVCRISVNACERSKAARQGCIAHHGVACCICGFQFGKFYGNIAEGYIHVHHLRPLAEIGDSYVVDPVNDLRPVCPNCHAVLHLGGVCRTIENLRMIVGRNGVQ